MPGQGARHPRRDGDRLWTLTAREQEVMRLISEGRSNQNIAETMHVGRKSILSHIRSIFSKKSLPPNDLQRHRRVTLARMQWEQDISEHDLVAVDAKLESLIRDLLLIRRRINLARNSPGTPGWGADTDDRRR